MRLLFTNFHSSDGGGHVTYILHLARALAGTHDVSIATPATSRLYRYAAAIPGVTVIDQWYTSRIQRMIPEVRQLRERLRAGQYDVVHINGSADHRHMLLACAGLQARPALVWTKHNDHQVSSFGNRLRAWRATDQAIAVSDYVRRLLQASAYRRVPTTTIRHGVDTAWFAPVDETEKRRYQTELFGAPQEGRIVLGSSGGTDYDKGWLDLLAAVSLLPAAQQRRFRVVVAGSLPDREKMDRVRELGVADQVVFPGLVDDVRPVLAACDVGFVLSYREALSYACREVMALGLPALVSDVGGLPENVDPAVNGWIVPPHAPDAISNVLAAMLSEPGLIPRMGLAARQTAQRDFSLAPFITQTQVVYERAITQAARL